MKKLTIALCAIFIMFLVGCNTKPTTPITTNPGTAQTTTVAKYKDGVYTAFADKRQFGQENATVTIKKGKITAITLRRLDTAGKEVNYKDWVGKKDATGAVKPNLNKFRVDMAKKMIASQTYAVNTISGATDSTHSWTIAVQRALQKAKK